jgi:hypothetical protein
MALTLGAAPTVGQVANDALVCGKLLFLLAGRSARLTPRSISPQRASLRSVRGGRELAGVRANVTAAVIERDVIHGGTLYPRRRCAFGV